MWTETKKWVAWRIEQLQAECKEIEAYRDKWCLSPNTFGYQRHTLSMAVWDLKVSLWQAFLDVLGG